MDIRAPGLADGPALAHGPCSPYLMTMGTHSMLAMLEVKGETTEASAWESEMPTSAAFRAPQSLAPSPHMPTQYLAQRGGQVGLNSRAGSEPVRCLLGLLGEHGDGWVPTACMVPGA